MAKLFLFNEQAEAPGPRLVSKFPAITPHRPPILVLRETTPLARFRLERESDTKHLEGSPVLQVLEPRIFLASHDHSPFAIHGENKTEVTDSGSARAGLASPSEPQTSPPPPPAQASRALRCFSR